jgi:hypothetical protein
VEKVDPSSSEADELQQAIERVTNARLEVRTAVSEADESMARKHLALASGHLARVVALHPGVTNWTPSSLSKKKAKKKGKHVLVAPHPRKPAGRPEQRRPRRNGLSRPYSGRSERRFVNDLRPGQETRGHSAHRRLEVRNLTGGSGTLVNVEASPFAIGRRTRSSTSSVSSKRPCCPESERIFWALQIADFW